MQISIIFITGLFKFLNVFRFSCLKHSIRWNSLSERSLLENLEKVTSAICEAHVIGDAMDIAFGNGLARGNKKGGELGIILLRSCSFAIPSCIGLPPVIRNLTHSSKTFSLEYSNYYV